MLILRPSSAPSVNFPNESSWGPNIRTSVTISTCTVASCFNEHHNDIHQIPSSSRLLYTSSAQCLLHTVCWTMFSLSICCTNFASHRFLEDSEKSLYFPASHLLYILTKLQGLSEPRTPESTLVNSSFIRTWAWELPKYVSGSVTVCHEGQMPRTNYTSGYVQTRVLSHTMTVRVPTMRASTSL